MVTNVELIRKELQKLTNLEGQFSAQKFHKEEIKTYGIKVPIVRKLAKQWFQKIKHMEKAQVFLICDELLQSGIIEEALVAFEWTYTLRKYFQESDFIQFEYWIESNIHNWSTCDNFCNNTIGAFLLKYPTYISHLKRWATTNNRWLQRAAAVSLIVPARQGEFLKEIFEIVELELESNDDLVQKGYGWLLKVSSKKNMEAVYEFVNNRKQLMPRTALRYALEHFPPQLKDEVLTK